MSGCPHLIYALLYGVKYPQRARVYPSLLFVHSNLVLEERILWCYTGYKEVLLLCACVFRKKKPGQPKGVQSKPPCVWACKAIFA